MPPRQEPGAIGRITTRRQEDGRWRASCQLRAFDGSLRYVNRIAATRGRAESAAQVGASRLRDKLRREHEHAEQERRDVERGITRYDTDPTTVRELTDEWRGTLLTNSDLHVATVRTWLGLLAAMYGEPVRLARMAEQGAGRTAGPKAAFDLIADVPPRQVTARDLKKVLAAVSRTNGSSTAKQMRTVLSYVFGLAEDRGLILVNPVPLLKGNKGSPVIGRNKVRETGLDHRRAPTVEQVDALRAALRADPDAAAMPGGGRRNKSGHPQACGRCATCVRYRCARPKRCRRCQACVDKSGPCPMPRRCYRCDACHEYVAANEGRKTLLCESPLPGARAQSNGLDVADLADFLFLVGCRLGEALGVLWSDLTFFGEDGEVRIQTTVVYAVGGGVNRQMHTKTGDDGSPETGARSVYLIPEAVAMLRARAAHFKIDLGRSDDVPNWPIFGSPQDLRKLRDPRNTTRAIKKLYSRYGIDWGRSHIGRKYLVNRLDARGVPHIEIAKIMGWRDLNTIKSYLDNVTAVSSTTKAAMRAVLGSTSSMQTQALSP